MHKPSLADLAEQEYEKLGDTLLNMNDNDQRAKPFITAACKWARWLYDTNPSKIQEIHDQAPSERAITEASLHEGSLIRGLAVMLFG